MSERAQQDAGQRVEPPALSPERFDAVIFDTDGVITDTAAAHAAAWKRLFDEYRGERERRGEGAFAPFDLDKDYREHIDGKPRYDGVRDFLASRGIALPRGDPDDGPDRETVCGLGNRKDGYFHAWLDRNRARSYPDTIAFIRALHAAGIQTAVISSSRNCAEVLDSAGVADLFDARVDGADMARLGLPGKPDPAIFLQAAKRLGVSPGRAAVVEDAQAGVEAGARGGFALVIGVDRGGLGDQGVSLRARGADLVVHDLGELLREGRERVEVRTLDSVPSVWAREAEIRDRLRGRRPAVFLDYDGTLTPIVEDPNRATLADDMAEAVAELAERYPVAVVSGRDLDNVRNLVGLDSLFYAGSHGFDIAGPKGWREVAQKAKEFLPDLDRAESGFREALAGIEGASVERKAFSIAVHYRMVRDEDVGAVEDAVDEVMARHGRLRKSRGKKVFDIKPRTDWDKGRAVLRLLDALGLDRPDVVPIYIGDDVTDEDAFRALADRGIGIVVRDGGTRTTAARYALDDPADVRRFLGMLVALDERGGGA